MKLLKRKNHLPSEVRLKNTDKNKESLSDFEGHYDIDGVSYQNGKVFVASFGEVKKKKQINPAS